MPENDPVYLALYRSHENYLLLPLKEGLQMIEQEARGIRVDRSGRPLPQPDWTELRYQIFRQSDLDQHALDVLLDMPAEQEG